MTTPRSPRPEFRFGALSADGSRASSTYKVWRERAGDVYVTHRAMGQHIKVSMHASGLWKVEDYTSGRRSEWGPTDAVMDQGVPAVRILVPGGGLTASPPADPDLDRIEWVQFLPGTRAVEFLLRLHPLTEEQPYVSPPGETVVPRTLGMHLGRHVLLSVLWRDRLPIEHFEARLADEHREGFKSGLDAVRAGRSAMSWWGVTDQTCFVIDTVVPDIVDD